MGVPAKVVRRLEEDEVNAVMKNAREYVAANHQYKKYCREI